jgi:L-fuconolactonase
VSKRLDSHQHFWRYDPRHFGWVSADMAAIRRDFLPGDLRPLLDSTGFEGTVAVQARQSTEETRWLLDLAREHGWIEGVVGWVDLRSPDLPAQLEEFTRDAKLVGVRHVVHDEPDDAFMLRPDFMRGIGALAEWGLTYDLLLFPRHLPVAAKLVDAFPEQVFVLDHLAKPHIATGELESWARDLRELARRPCVTCKLSGMVTEANWSGWRTEDFVPYLDVALEAFGAERVMIGSDWPVCTVAGTYGDVAAIVTEYVARLSADEQAAVCGGNCARIYGLPFV